MKEEQYIWSLISRKFSGEATKGELEELEELLRAQPEWQYKYEMLRAWWNPHQSEALKENAAESFNRLRKKLTLPEDIPLPAENDEQAVIDYEEENTSSKRGSTWLSISAVTAVLALISWYFIYNSSNTGNIFKAKKNQALSEVSTRYGSKSKATLPDGTTVWLNAGSKLVYNNDDFGNTIREVSLSGEGFFDVAPDAVHPFIIHTGKMTIRVLGTTFDVKSYAEDNVSEATLIQGSIEVTIADQPGKKILLKPHQKLSVFKDSSSITGPVQRDKGAEVENYKVSPITIIPEDSTIVETSWVENKLAFQSEPFSELAKQLERWYNVKIIFNDYAVKQYVFTGIFTNESIDQAFQALQITAPFHYKIEQGIVYISKS